MDESQGTINCAKLETILLPSWIENHLSGTESKISVGHGLQNMTLPARGHEIIHREIVEHPENWCPARGNFFVYKKEKKSQRSMSQ